jgi:hypothetical protein
VVPGEALVTYTLVEQTGTTILTLTLLYESKEVRDGVLKTPMDAGVAIGFSRLEGLLATAAASR